jgi:hypothetical protein
MRTGLVAVVALAACRSDAPAPGGPSGGPADHAAPPTAWVGACLDALDRAAAAPPSQRTALVLAGCQPCGVDWHDAIAMPVPPPAKVIAVVDACALGCAQTARSDFFAAISGLEDDARPDAAWRALGKTCPAALGAGAGDGRHVNGTWFALHQIGRRLTDAPLTDPDRARWRTTRAALWLPLPVVSQVGTQLVVPAATAVRELPATQATILAEALSVGALPRAIFDDHGLALAPDRGAVWPGDPVAPAGLAAALDARGERDAVFIAPAGLPAQRVLMIAGQLGAHRAALAVTRADGSLGATAVLLTSGPAARAAVIDADGLRVCATDRAGAVVGCLPLPSDADGHAAILRRVLAGHPRVALAVMPTLTKPAADRNGRMIPPPEVDTATLAARLDELSGLGVTEVIATALPDPRPTLDLAALQAALAEGASP